MKKILTVLLMFFVGQQALTAQTPPFKSGIIEDDFIYDVAPFPQCHASTIAETPKGLVAAFFGGTREKNPDVEIYVCRKEGEKWTAPVSVANGIQNATLRYPTWNPVLYQQPGGDLLLFYKVGPSPSTWKGWMKSSRDNGITWSEAKALPEGFIGPVKNKPVLVGKRLIAPSSTEDRGWRVHFELSDDYAKTWRMVGPINDGKNISAIQPTILVHTNKLQILARSENRAIMESWSSDNGDTWTPLAKTTLPNNNSGIDAVTLKDGRHLLVYNHILGPGNKAGGPRTPLNVSYSNDGKTWYAALVLENSPISEYSYPSIIQSSDGMVHIVYTWRRQKVKYVKIDPSKLEGKKIENGLWPY
ncbi:MAG TPA: sialidase family protein [Segetibacter sp.]|nr:sialidase family protein [Segetibacter sp.]